LQLALSSGTTGGVKVTTRHGEPWISVPTPSKQPEPANLVALKKEVEVRWGTIDLLDVLKEADYLTDFTAEFASVASREVTDRATLRRRLLLSCFALGTNMGIKRLADSLAGAGRGADTEAVLGYYRRPYANRDNFRAAVRRVVDATFAARDVGLGGKARHVPPTRRSQARRGQLQRLTRSIRCGGSTRGGRRTHGPSELDHAVAEPRADQSPEGRMTLEEDAGALLVVQFLPQGRRDRGDQKKGSHSPGQVGGAGQVRDDRRQRGRDDGLVEGGQEHPQHQRSDDDVAVVAETGNGPP
jgi:hypothetical protein